MCFRKFGDFGLICSVVLDDDYENRGVPMDYVRSGVFQ